MNISIAVADRNTEYAKRLAEGLQQFRDLTVYIYTDERKLREGMERRHFDIVLFDPALSEKRIEFSKVRMPLLLYSGESDDISEYAGLGKVEKYQRISSIYQEVIRMYSEKAGYQVDFDFNEASDGIQGARTDNTWAYLPYNGTTEWYHFNEEGQMQTGWLDDGGRKYYLHPIADGTRGRMYAGWNEIDGSWYYFNEVSDGTRGALITNSWVDASYVNQDGVWIGGKDR